MTHHILVAEPGNDTWTSIAHGLRRYEPQATILRVKDGEQAMRFLFQRGLLMEEPETPDTIVLNSQLPIVPMNAVMARLRQHPRTQTIPVIVISRDTRDDTDDDASESQQWLHRHAGVIVITGKQKLEKEVADAMHRLSAKSPPVADSEPTGAR